MVFAGNYFGKDLLSRSINKKFLFFPQNCYTSSLPHIIKYENFHQEFLNFYCITRATPFLRDNWSFKLPGKVLSKFINKKLSSLSTKLLHYLASTYNRIKNENFDQAFLNFYCIKRASPFLKENCRNFRKSFN